MMRSRLLVVPLALAILGETATAQVRPEETLLYRTYQVLVILRACDPGCPGAIAAKPGSGVVTQFGGAPLRSPVPSTTQIDELYRDLPADVRERAAAALTPSGLQPAAAAGIAGAFGASFVTGVVDFVLERAKAELTHSVFRDVNALFEKETDLAILFPTLHATVASADRLSYRLLVPQLRQAGRDDLLRLPTRIADRGLSLWPDSTVPWAVQVVSATARPALRIAEGAPPLPALANLADLDSDDVSDEAARAALRILGRVARETAGFTSGPSGDAAFERWLVSRSTAQLTDVLTRERARAVFLALLVEGTSGDPRVTRRLADADDVIDRLIALCERIRRMVVSQQAGQTMMGAPEPPTDLDLVRVAATAFHVAAELVPPNARGELDRAVRVADAVFEALAQDDWARVVLVAISVIPVDARLPEVPKRMRERFQRIVALVGALVAAQDSDAVRAALSAWADPVGGFRARREPGASVAVVAYVGAAAGREQVQDATPGTDLWGPFGGAFVPVGLEVGVGLRGASLGLLVSALDLGTLASYRLDDRVASDTAEIAATPDYNIAHVFSPGLWLAVGISSRYPLTIGGGVQYAPRLRRVEDGLALRERNALRWGGFIAVDVTLFRF